MGVTERRVLVSGTFDVENYGDCLFPVVAAHRLAQSGFTTEPVSPTSHATRWSDSRRPLAISDLMSGEVDFAGALIGGGNIIHNGVDRLPAYGAAGVSQTAYPSLWLGMTLLGAVKGVPVAWNAPGVSRAFTDKEQAGLIAHVIGSAAYASVRDGLSREHLGAQVAAKVAVVPDTAVEISRCWTRASLEPTFRELLARKGVQDRAGFFAVHVKERALQQEVGRLAAMIDGVSRQTGLTPIILALAPCHGDDAVARSLSRHLKSPHVALDDARELREIASAIAWSEAYAGSSLHGYITSYSYGRPGVIVGQPALPKFAGFMQHVGREEDLVADWETALARVLARPNTRDTGLPSETQAALDRHWSAVGSALAGPGQDCDGRLAYLGQLISSGCEGAGLSWALAPQLAETRSGPVNSSLRALARRVPGLKRLRGALRATAGR